MKIAYGTYAMPQTPLEEAFGTLAEMGYEGVEICISPRHVGAMPDEMDAARRDELRRRLSDLGLSVPALMIMGHLYSADDAEHEATRELLRQSATLAHELGAGDPPILAMGIGGRTAQWEEIRDAIAQRLVDLAGLAEEVDVVLAAEAHCGAAVDRSDRAIWLIETVGHRRVGLHFDIVHTFLSGEAIEDSVRRLVPITVHTHITDARRHADGSFDLLLLGDGELDATTYVRAMDEAGWRGFITLEVSARVWSRDDYDPVAAARSSYAALRQAFDAAGVPVG